MTNCQNHSQGPTQPDAPVRRQGYSDDVERSEGAIGGQGEGRDVEAAIYVKHGARLACIRGQLCKECPDYPVKDGSSKPCAVQ